MSADTTGPSDERTPGAEPEPHPGYVIADKSGNPVPVRRINERESEIWIRMPPLNPLPKAS